MAKTQTEPKPRWADESLDPIERYQAAEQYVVETREVVEELEQYLRGGDYVTAHEVSRARLEADHAVQVRDAALVRANEYREQVRREKYGEWQERADRIVDERRREVKAATATVREAVRAVLAAVDSHNADHTQLGNEGRGFDGVLAPGSQARLAGGPVHVTHLLFGIVGEEVEKQGGPLVPLLPGHDAATRNVENRIVAEAKHQASVVASWDDAVSEEDPSE